MASGVEGGVAAPSVVVVLLLLVYWPRDQSDHVGIDADLLFLPAF